VKLFRSHLLHPRLLLLAVLTVVLEPRAHAQAATEDKVKVAYIFNVVKFTDWPDSKFPSASAPLIIGCDCDASFFDLLDHSLAGKQASGHPLSVRRVSASADVQSCAVLFVGVEQSSAAGPFLALARRGNVLSVGESPGFLDLGGTVNFYNDQDTVHIEINPQNVSRAGLSLSSRLLTVAKIVR